MVLQDEVSSDDSQDEEAKNQDKADQPNKDAHDVVVSRMSKRKLPELWTRVISFQGLQMPIQPLYQVNSDLLLENAMPKPPMRKRQEQEWKPYFQPKGWSKNNPNASMSSCKLSYTKLK